MGYHLLGHPLLAVQRLQASHQFPVEVPLGRLRHIQALADDAADEVHQEVAEAEERRRRRGARPGACRRLDDPLHVVNLLNLPRAQRLGDQPANHVSRLLRKVQGLDMANGSRRPLGPDEVADVVRWRQQASSCGAQNLQVLRQRTALDRRGHWPTRKSASATITTSVNVPVVNASDPTQQVSCRSLHFEQQVAHGVAIMRVRLPGRHGHVQQSGLGFRVPVELFLAVLDRVRRQIVRQASWVLAHHVVVVTCLESLGFLEHLSQGRLQRVLVALHVTIGDGQLVIAANHGREEMHFAARVGRQVHGQIIHATRGEAVHRGAIHVLRTSTADAHAAFEIVPQAQDVPGLVHHDGAQAIGDHVDPVLAIERHCLEKREPGPLEPRVGGAVLDVRTRTDVVTLPSESGPQALRRRCPRRKAAALVGGPRHAWAPLGLTVVLLRKGEARCEVVQVGQPSLHPTVGHDNVAFEDLSAPRVHPRDAHAGNLAPFNAPGDRAVPHVVHVVILRPVHISWANGLHHARQADRFECRVPSLDAVAHGLAPTLGHRRVHIDSDLAPRQTRQVVAPYHRHLPVRGRTG
mmetsp:Transcript_97893/g.299145  ORF Transcript_97893/g.299145 Transcript_97893/m.299145 type:complete len:578 (-) Transcript_97893:780-2513(-)